MQDDVVLPDETDSEGELHDDDDDEDDAESGTILTY